MIFMNRQQKWKNFQSDRIAIYTHKKRRFDAISSTKSPPISIYTPPLASTVSDSGQIHKFLLLKKSQMSHSL